MFHAIIFDLDGTVLDNEAIWEEAFVKVAQLHSFPVVQRKWLHEPGIGVSANWRKLASAAGLPVDQLTRETRGEYWRLVGDVGNLPVREGLVDLVAAVKDRGWQTALATSGEWHMVEKELEELDLYLAFDVTTTGEEVLATKPDPEIYLLTCQKLGLGPSECVVIEDSLAGVTAAAEAGCWTTGIASSYASSNQLKKAGARLVVDNLGAVMVGLTDAGAKP